MPNRPLGVRVPEAERPAWERLLALARGLGVEEAERRLRAEPPKVLVPVPAAKPAPPAADPRDGGVRFVEARVLAALGRWRLPVQTSAKAVLAKHGLPDTAENRCAAMVGALNALVERQCLAWEEVMGEVQAARREAMAAEARREAAERRLRDIRWESRAAERERGAMRADLERARAEARRQYEAEHKRELERLHWGGYAPADLAAVVDAAQQEGLELARLPRLVEVVRQLGGPLRTLRRVADDTATWEAYSAHLRREVDDLLRQVRLEAEQRRAAEAAARAWTRARGGLAADTVPRRTLAEVRRLLVELTPAAVATTRDPAARTRA